VIFKTEVLLYFDELIFLLFEEEYFAFPENANACVDKIVDFIINEISTFPHKQTPLKLKKFGDNYIFYKSQFPNNVVHFFQKTSKQNSRHRNFKQSFSISK